MSSENTQRVSYIDQQMEYLENIPTRLLTIPRIVEYNELKEMNDLFTSQSDTWNSNEPIARYLFGKLFNTSSNLFYQHFLIKYYRALDILCSVEPITKVPLSLEIAETILSYIGNEFSFVRRRSVKALGEIAVTDSNFFVNHILLFVQIAKNDVPTVQIEMIKVYWTSSSSYSYYY